MHSTSATTPRRKHRYTLHFAIFLIAICAILTRAEAQKVFKCGNNYSQIPCADPVVIDAKDSRTSAQKSDADATTVRTAKIADQMEKDRLAQEKRDLASNTASKPQKPKSTSKKPQPPVANDTTPVLIADKTPTKKKKKKADPEYFTAQSPKAASQDKVKK